MSRKLIGLVLVVLGLGFALGCTGPNPFSSYNLQRRLAIAEEQSRDVGYEIDRGLNLEDYPTTDRWRH